MQKQYIYLSLLFFFTRAECIILVIDYGSPIAPYIQYCLQEAHVPSVLRACTITDQEIRAIDPCGIILSGGPFSVYQPDSPQAPQSVYELGVPLLGICYGQQLLCHQLGGTVQRMDVPERGPTELIVSGGCLLTQDLFNLGQSVTVWMGHEDLLVVLPDGFRGIAHTAGSPFAIIADDTRLWYGVQFHPEAPKNGWPALIRSFALNIVGEQVDATIKAERIAVDEGELFRSLYYGCCCGHD